MSFEKLRRPLRLLHTSDLHIGIYPDEAMHGLERVLDMARQLDVDAVLVAGDLFDTGRVAAALVRRVLDDMTDAGRPVVLLPGNHDTVLTSGRGSRLVLFGNLVVLRQPQGEMVRLDHLGLSVWGRPVYDHHPGFRPLEGVAPRPSDGWYVVMAHGMFMDEHAFDHRSSPISPGEVAAAPCDYVALGHVHVFRDVSQGAVPAFYSGAPSGPQARSVALVSLDPNKGVTVKLIPLP